MSDEVFATYKQGLKAGYEEKPQSLSELTALYWMSIYEKHYNWKLRMNSKFVVLL